MSYGYKAGEREVLVACNGDEAQLMAAIAAGKVTLAGVIAFAAESKTQDVIEMSDTGCVILRDGLRQQWGGLRLYPTEWATVAQHINGILAFCEKNAVELKRRGDLTKASKQAAKQAAKLPATAAPKMDAPTTSTQPA